MFVTNCRMCHSADLYKFLDLGSTPPADQFLLPSQLISEERYPLEVISCQECGLAQLSYVVPGDILFCRDYPYESSTTNTACQHWRDFAKVVSSKLVIDRGDLVVDIGSNVGILLQAFKEKGAKVIGVDPARNMAKIANNRGIETIADFFNEKVAKRIVSDRGQASVVTGTNVFAHVNDLDAFMKAINILLKPSGSLVIESPHFMALVKDFLYDTIYHEHLSYLSVKPLIRFFAKFEMEIYDIERQSNHGESYRYYVGYKGIHPVFNIVSEILEDEKNSGIYDTEVLDNFALAVAQNRKKLRALLLGLKEKGKRIAVVSAPAKGMTLLNYCDLGHGLLDFVTEKATLKIGKCTPGTHIPVVSDERLLSEQPDYALLLAWNFAEEIMKNLREFSDRGSKFIIPIPTPQIVSYEH